MRTVSLLLIGAAIAGVVYNGISEILSWRTLDAARRENEALRARREALRQDAFSLGTRAAEELDRGRQLARFSGLDRGWPASRLRPPATSASNEAIIAWLSSEGARLEALAVDLSSGDERPGSPSDRQYREAPDVDNGIRRARQLEHPEDTNTNMAERQLRNGGDSS
jgi:hypothetical protein